MEQNFERTLVEQCAPTLVGVKPASLFRVRGEKLDSLRQCVQELDTRLKPLGIRVVSLKECPATNACMVYVYRRKWVSRLLNQADHQAFLKKEGYSLTDVEGMLAQLSQRLCLEADYPHEIGVFLGYPLEDVIGFIENRGWNYACCGYWKVYGDAEAAQRCFAQYRTCTEKLRSMYDQGIPITGMIVAA